MHGLAFSSSNFSGEPCSEAVEERHAIGAQQCQIAIFGSCVNHFIPMTGFALTP